MSEGQHLALATPERALLSLPIAGVGSRVLAYLADFLLLLACWFAAALAFSLASDLFGAWGALSGLGQVLFVLGIFFVQWGYWTLAEVFWKGQTPGKRWVGIRVVRADGSPVGLFESAVRNLIRFVDFLPGLYAVGVVAMLIDKQHRRLGDLAAGTVLVRVEAVDLSRYAASPSAVASVPSGAAAPLSAQDAEVLTDFLKRADALEAGARGRLSALMASRFLSHLGEAERAAALADVAKLKALLQARLHG
jgi:uncharacterized RDD family membrane protein YckC